MNLFSYALTFIEGTLTFISPCILPMLPIYFFYLAGSPEVGSDPTTNRIRLLKNSIGFVFGFTIIFILLGVTVTSLGHFLASNKELMREVSGSVMILFGVNFMGFINIKFLSRSKRMDIKNNLITQIDGFSVGLFLSVNIII